LTKNSTFITAQRQNVNFSPKDLTEAKNFLSDKHPKSPYIAFYEQLKRNEEQQRNLQEYDFEKEMIEANEKEVDEEEEEVEVKEKEEGEEKPKKRKAVSKSPKNNTKKSKKANGKAANEDVVEDFEFSDDE
jgi:hypothetical protein